MKDKMYCPNHGLKMEEITLEKAKKRSLFMRFMIFLEPRLTKYDEFGEERIVLICPKNDYLTNEE